MYDADSGSILIKMPTPVHEEPFDDLQHALARILDNLPHDEDVLRVRILMNHSLMVGRSSCIPDILVSLRDAQGLSDGAPHYVLVGECAFSEKRSHAIHKLRQYVENLPHLAVVVLAVIQETKQFTSPSRHSNAWDFFQQSEVPVSQGGFFALRADGRPLTIDAPVVVGGHHWCQVRSVDYTVWVRHPGEDAIDLDATDAPHVAHGVRRVLFLT